MRIALVAPPYESVPPRLYGGTERVVYNLCRGLADAGVDVSLFASADSSVDVDLISYIDEALRLRNLPVADVNPYHLKLQGLVAKRASEFDLIHNHDDYWMFPVSEMTDTPLLSTLHGRLDLPDISQVYFAYPQLSFVSISDSQRRPMAGLNWLRTIYHGIDIEEFKFYSKPGSYLAFLGRITPEKRPEWAIQIAKKSGIPLKIAAKIEGKASQEYYDQLVRPHVDGKFIEFVGEISESEKSEFLGNALALVFPIDWPEPFGLVAIESLACGTPVLARPCGAAPELLSDGITGYCHLDIDLLANFLKDGFAIDRNGCRKWAEEKFSLRRMTEDYIDAYRHLIEFTAGRDRHRRHFLYPVQRAANGNS